MELLYTGRIDLYIYIDLDLDVDLKKKHSEKWTYFKDITTAFTMSTTTPFREHVLI